MMSPKNISVLVVDDDHLMREMLKAILRSEDYQVVGEASNGEDAVAMCGKLKPTLVLLDIMMPKMDGLQALVEIRKTQPAVKVLMVSGEATMDKVSDAIKKGAAGFVVKPLNAGSVLDRVRDCMKGDA